MPCLAQSYMFLQHVLETGETMMSVCICDQAFSHKYPPINISLRWQVEHVQDHCTVHPSCMDSHKPNCAQHRHPTTLQAVDQLHGTSPWRNCINSSQSCKPSHLLLPKRRLFDLFSLFLIYYPKCLSKVLLYLYSHDSVLKHFAFQEEKPSV